MLTLAGVVFFCIFPSLRDVGINKVRLQTGAESFSVSFEASNHTDKKINVCAEITVSKLVGHGKGAATWEAVGRKRISFPLAPRQTAEISDMTPKNKLLIGPGISPVFQAEVHVRKVEEFEQIVPAHEK